MPVYPAITPSEIVKRMGQPVRLLDSGEYGCPVCNHTSESYRLGPHMIAHWWEAGVERGTEPHASDPCECPFQGCGFTGRRASIPGHLVNVHDLERREATGLARTLGFSLDEYRRNPPPNRHEAREEATARAAAHKKKKAEKKAEIEVAPEPAKKKSTPPPQPDITGTDAALAVIMGTANGSVPTALIPEIVNYVDHTRDIIDKLRAQ